MIEPATFNALRRFRARVYDRFGARRDALFELLDAATVTGLVPSLVHLSLASVHRRRWGSLYDALAAGSMDTAALRELVAEYPLGDGQPIYAFDTSIWPRDDAETSPGRGHYFSSSRQSAGQPIVTGWSYAWLAQLSFTHDSWTAPLDVQRVPAGGDAHAVAAAQIWELLEHLPADGPVPLCVFAAGYDAVTLARELAELDGTRVAVLVRLRSDRCFYADPVPKTSKPHGGRPQRHGQKFACGDERTWWAPTSQHQEQHAQYGRVRVRAWTGVHAKTQNHPQHGSYRDRPLVRGTLVLVEVERLPRQTRIPKRLWLWWRGPGQPDLAVLWRAYVHRFDLEHTYKFCKQTLNWTTPRVRTPQQADRWTWLVRRVGTHSIPFAERRGSESLPLGQRLTRGRKAQRDRSMPSKRDISEGVWGTVPQDPRARVKAGLPEPQSPRVLFTLLDDHTSMARPLGHVEVNQST